MINWTDRLIDKKVDKITIEPLNMQKIGYLVKAVQFVIFIACCVIFYYACLLASIFIDALFATS